MSRFEPNKSSAARKRAGSQIRSSPVYAGHTIKPLRKLNFLAERLQSRTGSRYSGEPEDPCPYSLPKAMSAFLPFERPLRISRGKE